MGDGAGRVADADFIRLGLRRRSVHGPSGDNQRDEGDRRNTRFHLLTSVENLLGIEIMLIWKSITRQPDRGNDNCRRK